MRARWQRLIEIEGPLCAAWNRRGHRRSLKRLFMVVSRLGDGVLWYLTMALLQVSFGLRENWRILSKPPSCTLSLFDAMGKRVARERTSVGDAVEFALADLPAGPYRIQGRRGRGRRACERSAWFHWGESPYEIRLWQADGSPAPVEQMKEVVLLDMDFNPVPYGTDVAGAGVNWGTPEQRFLRKVPLDELERLLDSGQFPAASMGPKVEAVSEFFTATGNRGIICHMDDIEKAVAAEAGTEIVP